MCQEYSLKYFPSGFSTIANIKTTPPATTGGPCVVVDGPGLGKPCQFPFLWRYNGVNYNGCAFDKSTDISPWCSTKVFYGALVTQFLYTLFLLT